MCHSDTFDKGIKMGTGHYEEHMCHYFEVETSVQMVSFEDFLFLALSSLLGNNHLRTTPRISLKSHLIVYN